MSDMYHSKSVAVQKLIIETAQRSLKEQVKCVLLLGFAECGNRKALRLRAQGVYSCK